MVPVFVESLSEERKGKNIRVEVVTDCTGGSGKQVCQEEGEEESM